MRLLTRPRVVLPSNETSVGTVRVGDLVTFDYSSVDTGIRAVYAGPSRQNSDRMDLIGPESGFSNIDPKDVTAAHRRVGVDPEPQFGIDSYHERQYDRLTANAQVLYKALRAEFGWYHYSAYGKASHAHGRRY